MIDLIDKNLIPYATPHDKLEEAFRVSYEILENLSPQALDELLSGYQSDVDLLLKNLVSETYASIFGGLEAESTFGKFNHQSTYYLEKLGETIENILVTESLPYFIMNVMPDFEINWHHIEWADAVQNYKYLNILAARDHGKCFSPETPVRMFNGEIKPIKDIKEGDLVMGPDSKPRKVLSIHKGIDKLFKIKQSKGDDYVINSKHTMTLLQIDRKTKKREIVDIDLPDLLKFSDNWIKECFRGFKVAVEYPERKLEIDPYYMGLWLGDGNGENGGIFNNVVLLGLRDYGVVYNKHIPKDFLINSRENRLKLLAGLLDSDGNLYQDGFHIGTIYKNLAKEIKDLADSLGFRTSLRGGIKFNKQLGRDYESYSVTISGNLHEIPTLLDRKQTSLEYNRSKTSNKVPEHIDGLPISVISSLEIEELQEGEYVGFTCDGDNRFVLGDGTVTHNSYFFSNAYVCWKLYRYNKWSKRPELSKLGKEGYLFSFSKTQATRLLTTVKESISENPILREKLYPGKDGWAETKIICKNGTRVIVESAGASTRGAHPGWIVVDDFLKDNVLYSEEQRKKYTDYFHSVIMNMIQPTGQVIVVGTPFHANDLYGDLKTKKGWHCREYPSIFPDGRILWERRYNLETLLEKKTTQGTINFSREHLCRPITSDSSIFPYHILERALVGSQLYTMVNNIESFPIKLQRVGIGVDLAISSSIGADYTVMVVGGIDEQENLWILNVTRLHGASYAQQIATLKTLNLNFRPGIIQIESNGFQAVFGQMAERENLPVRAEATTAKSKNDLKTGLPGLALMFERGKIKIPHGDQRSRDIKDLMFTEFSSVTWTNNGLQATGSHDDIPMAVHQLARGLDYRNTGFGFSWM